MRSPLNAKTIPQFAQVMCSSVMSTVMVARAIGVLLWANTVGRSIERPYTPLRPKLPDRCCDQRVPLALADFSGFVGGVQARDDARDQADVVTHTVRSPLNR